MKIVIMAGGKGTRFWPWSVKQKPKQFLALTSGETMIQKTYRRYLQHTPADDIYVVTIRDYLHLLREQLPNLEDNHIIIEPEQRDTAPCIAYTARFFMAQGSDEALLIAPADHDMEIDSAFPESIRTAEQIAGSGHHIVTLGIQPTRAETAYGYIEAIPEPVQAMPTVYKVARFTEKPKKATAEIFLKQPNMFWNSGMFVWRPSTIAHYLSKFQPDLWNMLESAPSVEDIYPKLPDISIDYAVMEKAKSIYMIPLQFPWDDVGMWSALKRLHPTDQNSNLLLGDAIAYQSSNNIIKTGSKPTIVIGAHNLIIVSTEEGTLVCSSSKEHELKRLLKDLHHRQEESEE